MEEEVELVDLRVDLVQLQLKLEVVVFMEVVVELIIIIEDMDIVKLQQ